MADAPKPRVREYADRGLREQLRDPENLRDLLREVVPSIVDRIDFSSICYIEVDHAFAGGS